MAWICGYQTSFIRRPPNGGLISKPHCNDINNEWHLISMWPHVSPLTKKSRSPNVCSRDDVWRTQKAFLGRPLTWSLESLATCPGGNEGGQGGHYSPRVESSWGRGMTAGVPESPNSATSTFFKMQYISFRKTSGSNMGAPNFLLAAGAI